MGKTAQSSTPQRLAHLLVHQPPQLLRLLLLRLLLLQWRLQPQLAVRPWGSCP